MATKKLQVVNEEFDYPINGSSNYAEEATGWAEAVTDVLKEISGPGDISTRETKLDGTPENGDPFSNYTVGFITGLQFDLTFVQKVTISGIITREYDPNSNPLVPRDVESFTIEGAYNGTSFAISSDFVGNDTEVEFSVEQGKFRFRSLNVANTIDLRIKYSAKALIDEDLL